MCSTSAGSAERAGVRLRDRWVVRRWATWLAVGVAGLLWGVDVASLRELLLVLPLVYAVVVSLGRRAATWPVLAACSLVFVVLSDQQLVRTDVVLLAVAAGALGAGLVHGRDRGAVVVQGLGVVMFGAIGLLGAVAAPDAARYLVAAGWLAHAGWDAVHLVRDRVVSRSYAEWCGVLDVLVAVGIVVALPA